MTSLLHHAGEGQVADDRTSGFPPSCCCWRGACRGGLPAGAGATPGSGPPPPAWRGAAVLRRRWPPSPCRGALAVHASAGGLTLLGTHALLSTVVARRTPMRCDIVSWESSGRCPSLLERPCAICLLSTLTSHSSSRAKAWERFRQVYFGQI